MFLLSLASAATLTGDHLAVGVASDGSLIDSAANLGILHDPDGGGGDPAGTDLLLPGTQFETWSLSTSEYTLTNAIPSGTGSEVVWEELVDNGQVQTLRGRLELPDAAVDLTLDLPSDRTVLYTTFVVTAVEDMDDVRLSRSVDNDVDYGFNGSYNTTNGAAAGVAWSGSQLSDKAMALASPDGVGGVCGWCATPDAILAGTVGDLDGDYQIGVASGLGSLAAWDSVEVVFVYAFAATVDEAVLLAEESAARKDLDGDGLFEDEGDCDDRDAWAGMVDEVPDGIDNDCDGEIDEDTSISDDDGDGMSEADGDCDDTDAGVTDCPEAERPAPGVIDDLITENEAVPGGCGTPVQAGATWLIGLLVLRRRR